MGHVSVGTFYNLCVPHAFLAPRVGMSISLKSQKAFSVKSQILKILGFAGQEANLSVLYRYLSKEKTNHHNFLSNRIQNTIVTKYSIFVTQVY